MSKRFILLFLLAPFMAGLLSSAIFGWFDGRTQTRATDAVIAQLNAALSSINQNIQSLVTADELVAVETNWQDAWKMSVAYDDVQFEHLGGSDDGNGWTARIEADAQILFPLLETLQRTVPARVTHVQMNATRAAVAVHIFGSQIANSEVVSDG